MVVFHIFFIYLSFCQKFITPSTFLNLSYITDPHFMSFSIQSLVGFKFNCTILLFNWFSPQVAVSGSLMQFSLHYIKNLVHTYFYHHHFYHYYYLHSKHSARQTTGSLMHNKHYNDAEGGGCYFCRGNSFFK